jgi:hypothetical protein
MSNAARRSLFQRVAALSLLASSSVAAPLAATSYVRMSDETLVANSPWVIEGVVESVNEAPTETPRTDYRVRVVSTFKGQAPAEGRLTVRVLGGRNRQGLVLRVWGAPSFAAGDEVLLFLRRNPDATYGIEQLIFGAFRKVRFGDLEIAWRDLSGAQELRFTEDGSLAPAATVPDAPRDWARFRSWIKVRAAGGDTGTLAYTAPSLPAGAEFTFLQNPPGGDCGNSVAIPIRWFTFPAPVAIRAHQDGQPGVAGGGFAEVQTALAVWTNEPNTNVNYVYGGTTPSIAICNNSLVFEDPGGEIAGSFSGSGTVAIGGPCFNCPTQLYNGTPFHATAKGFVITQDGIASIFDGSSPNRKAEELFAHELGHTLGLGHTSVPNSLMNPNLHNPPRGAVLSSDDLAGLEALYADSGPPAPPSAPKSLTATTLSSTTAELAWSDKSDNESEFRIERDSTDDAVDNFVEVASVAANSTSFADDGLSPSTLYRFRVRARNGGGNSGFSNVAAATTLASVPASAPAPPAGAWLETDDVAGFRFKVRIGGERDGTQVTDCVPDTLCVAGAIADRTEVFLRVIGPRPNDKLWAQMVRFTVSRVEIWIDQIAGAPLRYYELAGLPASTLVLSGINDSEAFDVKELGAAAAIDTFPLTEATQGSAEADPAPPAGSWLEPAELPGYRFKALIGEGAGQRSATQVTDCVPETLCVAGALPDRTEVFARIIGPRGNGFLWAQLVRFTVSPVELWIEQEATLTVRYYKLDKLPASTTELPGRNDSQAFVP